MRTVTAAALVTDPPQADMERGMKGVADLTKVTKPVTTEKKPGQRTGPRPVTKAAARPEKPAPLTKEQRQQVKLLLQRPDERRLLDKLLATGLEAGTLSADENDVAARLQARSKARAW